MPREDPRLALSQDYRASLSPRRRSYGGSCGCEDPQVDLMRAELGVAEGDAQSGRVLGRRAPAGPRLARTPHSVLASITRRYGPTVQIEGTVAAESFCSVGGPCLAPFAPPQLVWTRQIVDCVAPASYQGKRVAIWTQGGSSCAARVTVQDVVTSSFTPPVAGERVVIEAVPLDPGNLVVVDVEHAPAPIAGFFAADPPCVLFRLSAFARWLDSELSLTAVHQDFYDLVGVETGWGNLNSTRNRWVLAASGAPVDPEDPGPALDIPIAPEGLTEPFEFFDDDPDGFPRIGLTTVSCQPTTYGITRWTFAGNSIGQCGNPPQLQTPSVASTNIYTCATGGTFPFRRLRMARFALNPDAGPWDILGDEDSPSSYGILLHELGHVLGLTDRPPSWMCVGQPLFDQYTEAWMQPSPAPLTQQDWQVQATPEDDEMRIQLLYPQELPSTSAKVCG